MVDETRPERERPSDARGTRGAGGSSPEAALTANRAERLAEQGKHPGDQGHNGSPGAGEHAPAAGEGGSARASAPHAPSALLINPISIAGGILAFVSACLIAVFIGIDLISERTNPYNAIVGFLLLPSTMVIGMVTVPVGALLRRRKLRRTASPGTPMPRTFPVLNLNDGAQFRLAILAMAGGLVAAGLIASAAVKGFEAGESAAFCGLTCHRVMKPEYVAYQSSTHARVLCADCHIGPGTSWFVKSKLSGTGQAIAYSMDTFPRPVPAPIESLRPSRDTCEQCHWPERLYGDRLQVRRSYAPDDRNTLREQTIVFRVGGGSQGEGVHWHIANELWYLPLDKQRQKIGWVEVRRADGSRQEYLDPATGGSITRDEIQAEKRRMDCIDCHNRVAHEVRPFDEEVDRALADGRLDASLPFVKRVITELGPRDPARPLAEDSGTVKARLASLPEVYERDYPNVYNTRRDAIVAAASRMARIYESIVFDEMRVDSSTYVNNIGHKQEGTGCARCHGKLVLVTKGQLGEQVSSKCDLCHYAPVTTSASAPSGPVIAESNQPAPRLIPHGVKGDESACLSCHSRTDPRPAPVSHAGRTNSMCLLCHKTAAGT